MNSLLRWSGCLPLVFALALSAQPQLPPAPLEAAQFDFWVGEWEVTNPAGVVAGTSRIERIAGGRGLLEHWTGARGVEGKSLNAWNSTQRCWQQFWVGGGGVLELRGGLDAQGRMVRSDRDTRAPSQKLINRITWTPNTDGTVRQHWETSDDDGASWKTSFDGLYRRREKK